MLILHWVPFFLKRSHKPFAGGYISRSNGRFGPHGSVLASACYAVGGGRRSMGCACCACSLRSIFGSRSGSVPSAQPGRIVSLPDGVAQLAIAQLALSGSCICAHDLVISDSGMECFRADWLSFLAAHAPDAMATSRLWKIEDLAPLRSTKLGFFNYGSWI